MKIFSFIFNFLIANIDKLPYSIRILLESTLRTCDGVHVPEKDLELILNWGLFDFFLEFNNIF